MSKQMTLGSLFSGSGGFELGGILSGIRPVWNSEIEPFPIRVTMKRMPFVKHYGDVSVLNGSELEPVDIITFGSPCQDMSIAGRREGLEGSRSSLFYEAVRIVKEMREATNGEYPKFIVWENVAGAFSSGKGEDFRAVLTEIARIKDREADIPRYEKWPHAGLVLADGYSVAWRLLDAQHWGVPQRRKRIYLVADLAGGRAGKILFESEGVSGYSAESFRAWQRAAGSVKKGAGATGSLCLNDQGGNRMDVTEGVTGTLRAEAHHPPVAVQSAGFCTEHSAKAGNIGYEEERAPTLRAGTVPAALMFENHSQDARYKGPLEKAAALTARYGTGGNNQPLVMQCFGICSKDSNGMKSGNPKAGFYEAKTARTLDANGGNPGCNQGGMAVVSIQGSMIGRKPENGPNGSGVNENISFTLDAADRHGVAYEKEPYTSSKASHFTAAHQGTADTLVATDYKDPPLISDAEYIVRRLTPTECARLQGFPDWWCEDLETDETDEDEIAFWRDIFETHRKLVTGAKKPKTDKQIAKWLKDPHSDSAEYKMWGNGVALPCVAFVLSGIRHFSETEQN